ncbi:hypothetical protein [Aquimarina aquimarini]|uniref:hypothetical protein n=1 Tax=Aquimarina aquimarini TaxID=1191734 RepID=UPI000D55A2CF|nr:hypothetical protein [Aquimarina aquimarini]
MKKIVLVTMLMTLTLSFGQKRKDIEGSIKNLKGITEYKLVFDYENLKVHKFDTEEEFLKDKMDKREEKNVGGGEKFKKSWFADRENLYEPKYIESFNKRFDGGAVKVGKDIKNAKYTMKVKTTWIYPGYNVGVVKQPSKVNATIIIYETANPDKIVFSTKYFKVPGSNFYGADFNSGYRIAESYAKLAKEMAKYILKKAK